MNALAVQASSVALNYGRMTTDGRWESTRAWSAPLTSGQQKFVDRAAGVTVHQTINPQPGMSERQVGQISASSVKMAYR